jgi:hypothetical protein
MQNFIWAEKGWGLAPTLSVNISTGPYNGNHRLMTVGVDEQGLALDFGTSNHSHVTRFQTILVDYG